MSILSTVVISLGIHSGDVGLRSDILPENEGERPELCFSLKEGSSTKQVLQEIQGRSWDIIPKKNDLLVFDTLGVHQGITFKGAKGIYGMPGTSSEYCQEVPYTLQNDTAISEFLRAAHNKNGEDMKRALDKIGK